MWESSTEAVYFHARSGRAFARRNMSTMRSHCVCDVTYFARFVIKRRGSERALFFFPSRESSPLFWIIQERSDLSFFFQKCKTRLLTSHLFVMKKQILQGCVVLQVRRLRPGRLVRGFFFLYLFVGFVRASDFSFLCLSRLRLAGVELLLKRASGRLRVCARGSNQN